MSRHRSRPRNGKPFVTVKHFALELGWPGLRMRQVLDGDKTITWYVAGKAEGSRNDLFVQINECPIGQTITYTAAVYAIRYGLCSGWHSMTLSADPTRITSEVERLDAWLHRRWFDTLAARRQFRSLHPECAGWSWSRIGRERLPYEVVDAGKCVTARAT